MDESTTPFSGSLRLASTERITDDRHARFLNLKQKVQLSRFVRTFSAALIELRALFLEDTKALAVPANKLFFDTWCQEPFVELGWQPGEEFWSSAKCSAFLRDLDTVQF